MIQVLFNTLPQAEVRGNIENAIIVTPQMWGLKWKRWVFY
jgi:hypothetical protein